MKLCFLSLFVLIFANLSWASEISDESLEKLSRDYPGLFIIDESSVEFTKVIPKPIPLPTPTPTPSPTPTPTPSPDPFVIIDKIINLGKKIWGIVESGKPVVNIKTDWASATPEGIKHWTQLETWEIPKYTDYRWKAKNLYGITVIDLVFRIIYTYNGSYEGAGKYLTNVKIIPKETSVLWGYTLDVNVEIPSVFNVGTSKDPVAAMELVLYATASTVVKTHQFAKTFFVNGKGEFKDLDDQ